MQEKSLTTQQKIELILERPGMTLARLAKMLDITKQYASEIKNGRKPSGKIVRAIDKLIEISVSQLIESKTEEPPQFGEIQLEDHIENLVGEYARAAMISPQSFKNECVRRYMRQTAQDLAREREEARKEAIELAQLGAQIVSPSSDAGKSVRPTGEGKKQ